MSNKPNWSEYCGYSSLFPMLKRKSYDVENGPYIPYEHPMLSGFVVSKEMIEDNKYAITKLVTKIDDSILNIYTNNYPGKVIEMDHGTASGQIDPAVNKNYHSTIRTRESLGINVNDSHVSVARYNNNAGTEYFGATIDELEQILKEAKRLRRVQRKESVAISERNLKAVQKNLAELDKK